MVFIQFKMSSLIFILLTHCVLSGTAATWSYDDTTGNIKSFILASFEILALKSARTWVQLYLNLSDIGPSNWPGTCQTGKSQSPINIDTSSVSEKRIPRDPFIFRGYNRAPKSSQLLNNGHSVKLSFKELKKAQNLPSVIFTISY